jgi:hypothetical protein
LLLKKKKKKRCTRRLEGTDGIGRNQNLVNLQFRVQTLNAAQE